MSSSVAVEKNTTDLLFALLRSELSGAELSLQQEGTVDGECLAALYACAKQHDLAHMVGAALEKHGLMSEIDPVAMKFQKQQMTAVYRYQQIQYELGRIAAALSEARIAYLPLKGAVVRDVYPEPWMRTSCDIDVLVHEEDLDRAVEALQKKLNYRVKGSRNFHDISLFSENGTHLELHFNILENMENIDRLLARVWEYAQADGEDGYGYRVSNEYFAFHLLAHMSYHFVTGGCGVRAFIDLWLWRRQVGYDEAAVEALCKECGIDTFARAVRHLSEVWFAEASIDEISLQMQEFILRGGVYGSLENKINVQQTRKGGKLKYLLSRIFGSYEMMQHRYPILRKHRWMMPFCQVHRWFSRLRKGDFRRAAYEVKTNQGMSAEQIERTSLFLEQIGLQ